MNHSLNPQKNTPYLALPGELWGALCEDIGENQLCYISFTLYMSVSALKGFLSLSLAGTDDYGVVRSGFKE